MGTITASEREREILKRSVAKQTSVSRQAICEVSMASMNSRTVRTAMRFPHGSCTKTLGSVMKSSPDPALGSSPKEKMLGKIISPAQKAIAVSPKQTTMLF